MIWKRESYIRVGWRDLFQEGWSKRKKTILKCSSTFLKIAVDHRWHHWKGRKDYIFSQQRFYFNEQIYMFENDRKVQQ